MSNQIERMKISVVIVSYNARYYLEQCLHSVEAALTNLAGEIIVVDNDSPEKPLDFIREKFPNVQFIHSKENLGFAKANNLGVEKAKGEYVLILNPDMMIPENLFDKILPFAEAHTEMGALGIRLIDANGNFHPESKRNIPTLQNTFGKLFGTLIDKKNSKGYYKSDVGEFETAPAEVLVGAFMLIRRDVYVEVGGFDPRYFMYGEDIDLSYTLELNGYKNYYFGEISAIHYKGESTRKDGKYLKIFFGAMEIFISKYFKHNLLKYLIFKIGLKLRYFWALVNGAFKPEDKRKRVVETAVVPEKIQSVSEIKENSAQILLDGNIFTNSEILAFISNYSKPGRQFYIHPKQMNVIIGDAGILEI
ncbi:MAG TPA: glycosyltransferase family 2 protein [Moheibacter sp.]|nr:glycosyltransferase family 2 protein [Moheibacter sp.]